MYVFIFFKPLKETVRGRIQDLKGFCSISWFSRFCLHWEFLWISTVTFICTLKRWNKKNWLKETFLWLSGIKSSFIMVLIFEGWPSCQLFPCFCEVNAFWSCVKSLSEKCSKNIRQSSQFWWGTPASLRILYLPFFRTSYTLRKNKTVRPILG